jgi:hypothetical protein
MAAATAGVVALSTALNLWGLVELEKLAYAASLTPFIPGGVKEYSREEVFNILRSAPDPYEKFREIAKAANAGRVKLAEPWESLRVLILPTPSGEEEGPILRGFCAGGGLQRLQIRVEKIRRGEWEGGGEEGGWGGAV